MAKLRRDNRGIRAMVIGCFTRGLVVQPLLGAHELKASREALTTQSATETLTVSVPSVADLQ